MVDKPMDKTILREIEKQNSAVANAFRTLRYRSKSDPTREEVSEVIGSTMNLGIRFSPMASNRTMSYSTDRIMIGPCYKRMRISQKRWSIYPAIILLITGLIFFAIIVGPVLFKVVIQYWRYILLPIGGLCLGAGAVLLVSRIGTSPLRNITPPDEESDNPLQELSNLAERTASRLHSAYTLQLLTVILVGAVFICLIAWSMIMVSRKQMLYASAFGSGSVAMVILTQWKWQPFDRINQARQLADKADTLATGLRLRMRTISEIENPSNRAKAQWQAVSEYLDRS